jgi:hypothetical protein
MWVVRHGHTYRRAFACAWAHAHAHTHTHACTHTCTLAPTHTHTHTHTHHTHKVTSISIYVCAWVYRGPEKRGYDLWALPSLGDRWQAGSAGRLSSPHDRPIKDGRPVAQHALPHFAEIAVRADQDPCLNRLAVILRPGNDKTRQQKHCLT